MWCRHSFALISVAISVATSLADEGGMIIRLGGVRNVTATVSESDGYYRVAVEMLTVKAFDPATNKALNLSKGRMYAAQALGKRLNTDSLTIRGLEVRESGTKGESFRLVALVPQEGVSTAWPRDKKRQDRGEPTPPSAKPVAPQGGTDAGRAEIRVTTGDTTADFLNRKSDYLDTIVRLREALSEEGESLASKSPKPDEFYDFIETVEERAEAAFKTLARQVGDDKLLLSVEREELHPALKKSHDEVLESLKSAVARFDQRQEKAKKERKK